MAFGSLWAHVDAVIRQDLGFSFDYVRFILGSKFLGLL